MFDAFLFFGLLLGALWIIGHFIEKKNKMDEFLWNERVRRENEKNR